MLSARLSNAVEVALLWDPGWGEVSEAKGVERGVKGKGW